jgi:hypothetical protein
MGFVGLGLQTRKSGSVILDQSPAATNDLSALSPNAKASFFSSRDEIA